MDYRSQGDTRVTINGSRHYKTPYGALPSVTTILSETQGNKAALERWAKKNPGGREAAAARGTKVHSLMEEYLLGIEKDPVIDNKEIAEFWDGLPENLSKLENVIWAENPANVDDYAWTKGSDGISLSLIHISEPTRQAEISYAVFCLKKKNLNPFIT